MAEEARKEPSMEEILSSIRKIIADDDDPATDASPQFTEETDSAIGNDDFEVDFGMDEPAAQQSFTTLTEVEPVVADTQSSTPPEMDPSAEPPSLGAALAAIPREEKEPMMSTPLADTKTADDAASYLSKLLDKVEFGEEVGGDTSIDNLVKELLRPMMKAWLDENLPAVVERHVEAEVARIARMAR